MIISIKQSRWGSKQTLGCPHEAIAIHGNFIVSQKIKLNSSKHHYTDVLSLASVVSCALLFWRLLIVWTSLWFVVEGSEDIV